MSAALGGGMGMSDKGLRMPLLETLRQAWADPDLRAKIQFVLLMFGVYVLGVNISVPIPGISPEAMNKLLEDNAFFNMLNSFGGGGLKRISIFALGLNPYITSSVIMQILTTALPQWKKELQEGGEYARRQQNKRTRFLTLALCIAQGMGLIRMMGSALPPLAPHQVFLVVLFWTAGAMFMLWLGEQISERGIGNGISLMIFAGIMISMPSQFSQIYDQLTKGLINWFQVGILLVSFMVVTWLVVLFSTAQRRIPIQHMRRVVGMKMMGGQTSYLPLSVNLTGVIPLIFAVSLALLPTQFANMFPANSGPHDFLNALGQWIYPGQFFPQNVVGSLVYMALIFFFTYFYTAIQFNVEDIANNLKRGGSFIPGVRPGKQTRDFLDGVISRITIVGALFLSFIALFQAYVPALTGIRQGNYLFGTSLLILVSVALDTMRQIESNLLMKHYGQG